MTSARVAAGLALALVAVVVAILITGSSSPYMINARFANAGGLVKGGLVEIAGRSVGRIASIGLTADGEANVALAIDDPADTPLHVGTRADIRAVGQGTITNNYILLSPGLPTQPAIRSGGVLPESQTAGIVPIDALLNSFGPAQRNNLDALVAEGAQVYAGSGSAYFNRMLDELNPALAQLDGFGGELALDRPALSELVQTAATASHAVAVRSGELTDSISHMAVGLGAIARRRSALNDLLARLPGFLGQTRGTLAETRAALLASRSALRDTPAAAGPLAGLFAETNSTLPPVAGAVRSLNEQLPLLDQGLDELVPLRSPTVTALHALGSAMKGLTPILQGLRYYGSDVVLGLLAGVATLTQGEYDSLGHYSKTNVIQSPQTLPSGVLSQLLSAHPLVPGTFAVRTGLNRRCPGGSQPPAPDGSSPWLVGSNICTSAQDVPLSVDFP